MTRRWCDGVSNYGNHNPVCSACLNRKEVNSKRSKSIIGFAAPGFRASEDFFLFRRAESFSLAYAH